MARARGADGVGLYRTEFLFLRQKGLPTEDEQFIAYRDLVLGMGGLPVTIRTLDLGADKADAAGLVVRGEDNPALGVRGVRLSLRYPAVFSTQIRAILRAACYGPVRVLVPMVTQPDELIAVRTLFKLARQELKRENIDLPEKLQLGAMIEVPAAAINVRALLEHSDFLAIGTNDLAQYVLAADRGNDALENIYNPLQPALLRLLAYVITEGRRAKKGVSLCGEIGGDVNFTGLLLALGLCEFSMHPSQLLHVRDRLATLDHATLRAHAPRILRSRTHEEAEALLASITG
jgi:phosphotransferase system enzyme I (PtsI)